MCMLNNEIMKLENGILVLLENHINKVTKQKEDEKLMAFVKKDESK